MIRFFTSFLLAAFLLLVACERPDSMKATPRFQPGDMVEFKGLGLRSIVERVACDKLECFYDLRLHCGPRERLVPEVVLEPVALTPRRKK